MKNKNAIISSGRQAVLDGIQGNSDCKAIGLSSFGLSSSWWSWSTFLFTNKDGGKEACADYRRLNDITMKEIPPTN